MYPNVPAGFVLARYHFLTGGGDHHAFIICGHHNNTGGTDPVVIANALFNSYGGNAFVDASDLTTFEDVQAVVNNAGTLVEGTSTVGPTVGGISASPMSPQVAVLVHKSSGLLGRHFNGRLFVPGIADTELQSDMSSLTSGALTALQAGFDAWLADLVTRNLVLHLLHRNVAVLPTPVTHLSVEPQVGTQRRRNRKAAHH
jgi:hypothetical protein